MAKVNGKVFDLKLLGKLMDYSNPYRLTYYFVLLSAILLSVFSTLSPYLLKIVIDDYITPKDYDGLVFFSLLMLLNFRGRFSVHLYLLRELVGANDCKRPSGRIVSKTDSF